MGGGGAVAPKRTKVLTGHAIYCFRSKLLPQHFVSKNYNLKSSLKISSHFSPTNKAKSLIQISYASVLIILEI